MKTLPGIVSVIFKYLICVINIYMSSQYFNAPHALESNPPIVPQYYRPGAYYITGISQGSTTTITTNVDNQYIVGQQVRFVVPNTYSMVQLNEQIGYVQSILTSTSFTVNIDSSKYNSFNSSPAYGPTKPQVMAIGDINSGVPANASGRTNQGTTIPGAFINTSPLEGTWLN